MATVEKLSKLEKKVALSLASVFGFRMMGLFIILPVLATYSQHLTGVTPFWIGLAIGAYGFTQALLQIPMGILSDKYGRKPVIIAGLLVFALGSIIAAMADSIYGVVAGRILQGMGAVSSAILAMAADLSRDEQRVKVMATIGACIGFSFALSLFLGSYLVQIIGLSGLFLMTAALALISLGIVAWVVPTPMTKAPVGDTVAAPEKIKDMLRNPQLLRLNFGIFVLHLLLTALFVVLPMAFVDAGFAREAHWKLYFPAFVASLLFMVPMVLMAVKYKAMLPLFRFAIMLLFTALMWMLYDTQNIISLTGATIVFFTGFNYLEASLPSLISKTCPVGAKGSAMGIYSSCQFLGAFFGGLLAGAIYQYFGVHTVLQCIALLLLCWLVITQGMKSDATLKSCTLTTSTLDKRAAQHMLEQLNQLTGVAEAIVVPSEKAAYLKVNEQFDIRKAQALVGSC
tara:strand:- start:1668 stop:3035 length:1368 start_codon:yes stop_codon:yes gene_type:complete